MKKMLSILGALSLSVVPTSVVVSCDHETEKSEIINNLAKLSEELNKTDKGSNKVKGDWLMNTANAVGAVVSYVYNKDLVMSSDLVSQANTRFVVIDSNDKIQSLENLGFEDAPSTHTLLEIINIFNGNVDDKDLSENDDFSIAVLIQDKATNYFIHTTFA